MCSERYTLQYEETGKLPDDVYFQIDGGPENANAVVLGLAELMVHRGKYCRMYTYVFPTVGSN